MYVNFSGVNIAIIETHTKKLVFCLFVFLGGFFWGQRLNTYLRIMRPYTCMLLSSDRCVATNERGCLSGCGCSHRAGFEKVSSSSTS